MKVIDLTLEITHLMNVYPGDPEVEMRQIQTIDSHGYNLSYISMGTHTGTHVDAYSHMHDHLANLDDIPLNNFFGVTQLVRSSDDFPSNIGLLFNEEVDVEILDKLLISEPIFVGGNISYDLEKSLLSNKIITYTNLINLDLLPLNKSFMFYGLPLKIKGGDGSPVRAIAIVE